MGSRIFYGALGDGRKPISLIRIAGVRMAEWAAGFGEGLSVAGVGDLWGKVLCEFPAVPIAGFASICRGMGDEYARSLDMLYAP